MCVNFYAPGDVRIEEMKEIPITGEGEVLVKVEACAICGTDVKSFLVGNPRIKPPRSWDMNSAEQLLKLAKVLITIVSDRE